VIEFELVEKCGNEALTLGKVVIAFPVATNEKLSH
jgi:hypothetical protein